MTRITTESLRIRMRQLQEQMELLQEFNRLGFAVDLCLEHQWKIHHYSHNHGVGDSLDGVLFSAYFVCERCGVKVFQQFSNEATAPPTIADPWADLRPEQEEE